MKIVAITAAVFVSAFALIVHSPSANAEAQQSKSTNIVTVQAGDSLSNIATAQNSTYVRLFYANIEIENPDLIFPGEKIRIPDASEQLATRPLPADVVAPAPVQTAAPVVQQAPQISAPTQRQPVRVTRIAGSGIWDQLALCESGGNWSIDTHNSFYGGLQFTLSSWQGVGGIGYPNQASREEQISRAQILQSRQGWGAWPACAARLGLI
jgi:hypothetical protein